jgi:hypothetical protein
MHPKKATQQAAFDLLRKLKGHDMSKVKGFSISVMLGEKDDDEEDKTDYEDKPEDPESKDEKDDEKEVEEEVEEREDYEEKKKLRIR